MSAKNITKPTGDAVQEETRAPSNKEDLVSLGVKTSDGMEPHALFSGNSPVLDVHTTDIQVQESTGIQTRSTTGKLPKYQTAYTDIASFKRLHKLVYGIITTWLNAPGNKKNTYYKTWEATWTQNIAATHTFSNIKNRLKIQTIEQYYDHIIQCPSIQQQLDIVYDPDKASIKYRKNPKNSTTDKLVEDVDDNTSVSHPVMTAAPSVMPVATSDIIQTPKNLSATTVASLNDFSPFNDILEPNDTQKAIWAYITLTYPEATLLLESNPSMRLETTCDNNSFPKLHRMIYELIRFWAKTDAAQYYSFYEIWETWDGVISSTSHFRAVQHWMNILTLQDYMDAVQTCPYIADNIEMDWDENTHSIKWHVTQSEVQTAFQPPNYARNTIHKANAPEPENIESSTDTTAPEPNQPFLPEEAFRELMDDFQEEKDSEGTKHTNRFVHFLQDKINGIMGHWGNQIKNAEKQLEDHMLKFNATMNDFETRLEHFRRISSTAIQKTNAEVAAIDAKVSFHLSRMQERADTCVTRISQATGRFDHKLIEISTEYIKKFTTELEATAHKSTRDTMDNLISNSMQQHLDQLDHQATELLVNMEETVMDYMAQMQAQKETLIADQPTPPPTSSMGKPSVIWNRPIAKRFAHIAAAHPDIADSATADHSNALFPPHNTVSNSGPSRDPWGRTSQSPQKDYKRTPSIPATHTKQSGAMLTSVQPLNHTHFINRAQFQFTGRMFTFYTQIYNSGPQYGVYLVPLDEVSNDQSLCPFSVNGHVFTDQEYRAMAATLYEKLARTDVISMTYTDFRNIIDRYADLNDGYLILREMLEDEHPGMKKDPIYRAPNSSDCDGNLQEYTTRFINWLTAERLNDRYFSDKEQVLHYLAGLDDEFHLAVQYVNTLLDTWSHTGINPKCAIRSLPKTIQSYLDKHHGNAVIRTTKGNPNDHTAEMLQEIRDQLEALKQPSTTANKYAIVNYVKDNRKHKGGWKDSGKTTTGDISIPSEPRKSVDIFCDACGGHGHPWATCDYTAKLLKAIDYIASLDPASRKTILENYHKEQTRRRQWKQLATTGRARQLRDSGDTEGLFDLMQEYQSYLDFSQSVMPLDHLKDNDE
jgi:hypothetical protein